MRANLCRREKLVLSPLSVFSSTQMLQEQVCVWERENKRAEQKKELKIRCLSGSHREFPLSLNEYADIRFAVKISATKRIKSEWKSALVLPWCHIGWGTNALSCPVALFFSKHKCTAFSVWMQLIMCVTGKQNYISTPDIDKARWWFRFELVLVSLTVINHLEQIPRRQIR